MLKSLKCFRKGHLFVDSRSSPGTQVCVRCRLRKPFEGLAIPGSTRAVPADRGATVSPVLDWGQNRSSHDGDGRMSGV